MSAAVQRNDVEVPVAGSHLAAWVWHPDEAATCVVMGHGFSMTRHDGLVPYAEAFAAAGAAVVAFDHRHLGDSPGTPRQRFRVRAQQEDWTAAIAYARRLPGVQRVVVWGFSFGGGHALTVGPRESVSGIIALAPFADGRARALATPPSLTAWILPRALLDAAGRHTTIPVTAQPGEHGAMTLPGEADGFARAIAPGSPWRNEISPQVFLQVALFRPVAQARKLTMPVWVGLAEDDVSVERKAVVRLARKAPRADLLRYPGMDHFDPFVGDAPARIAGDQVAWLQRNAFV